MDLGFDSRGGPPIMARRIEVVCTYCGKKFDKARAEIARNPRGKHFCSRSHSARYNAEEMKARRIERCCPCGTTFFVPDKKKSPRYCSRSCASHYSMNESRREAQRRAGLSHTSNLIPIEDALRKREDWKYAQLKELLHNHTHQFEYRVGEVIFDLYLPDKNLLVEFDGPHHKTPSQQNLDRQKEATARSAGYNLLRESTGASVVLCSKQLAHILRS